MYQRARCWSRYSSFRIAAAVPEICASETRPGRAGARNRPGTLHQQAVNRGDGRTDLGRELGRTGRRKLLLFHLAQGLVTALPDAYRSEIYGKSSPSLKEIIHLTCYLTPLFRQHVSIDIR